MSPKTARAAAVKKKKGVRSKIGLMSEVYVKEYDAQSRLGNSCCVFIKVKDEFRFLILADNVPEFQSYDKFFSVAIGASTSELGEAKDRLSELGGFFGEIYSPQDFYPTVALYFLSRYLKGVMDEFWSPRALAIEYMIFDPIFSVLHTIKFTGDYESYVLRGVDKAFFIIGGYNMRLRKELQKELQAFVDKADTDRKILESIGDRICKKYNLRVSALLHPQTTRVSPSGVQSSGATPGSQEG